MMPEYPMVKDALTFEAKGPWPTKADGELEVLFALPQTVAMDFLSWGDPKFNDLPGNLRGLRSYKVTDMPVGRTAGMEYHEVRREIMFGMSGRMQLQLEDVAGNIKIIELNPTVGVLIQPFILHTLKVDMNGSGFLVVCNTLFDPDDPATHDSFNMEAFRSLQEHHRG